MREDKLFQEREKVSGVIRKSPEDTGMAPQTRSGARPHRHPGADEGTPPGGGGRRRRTARRAGRVIPGTGLEVPEFSEAHVPLLRDDDMVEHPDAENHPGLGELPGDADVLG